MRAPSSTIDEQSIVVGLTEDPLSFIPSQVKLLGDVFSLKIKDTEITVVNDPTAIESIFNDGENYKKKKNESDEQEYLGMMSGICAMFTPEQVTSYTQCMSDAATRSIERIKSLPPNTDIDIFHEMMRLTLEIEIETLYSVSLSDLTSDYPELDLDDVCRDLMLADRVYGFDPVYTGLNECLPPFTPQTGSEAAKSKLLSFVTKVLTTFKKNPKDKTLMDYLVNNMPDEQAVQTALVILGAHHEVAVPAISRAWQLLSENSDIEKRLSSELSNTLGGRPATQADLPNLKYTSMVMCEVRRLYPCVWMVMRWSREEREINNYLIPKDSVVLMSQWVSHYDSRHFPQPLEFIPERWTNESIQAISGVPYFPFSKGIRSCAGEQFAEMQDTLILSTMAQHIKFILAANQDLSPLARRSNAPQNGILGKVVIK
ncbi:cytochrome P450 [Synechococcus sp. AH-551-E02]|nr:cytochrome P450 [Synechococcus sp. AH-551-E02]MDB4653314.1 cytochrome P450 [Synechococcus sp. AH-551-E02]